MYVDHNATSPISATVQSAVSQAMDLYWANPGSPHRRGQEAAARVEKARRQWAAMLGCASRNVFFTSGATEANAWVLHGLDIPVVSSAVEHPSVLAWTDEIIDVDSHGIIDCDALERRLQSGPAVVSVMAANNETGVIQPYERVFRLCQQYGAKYHCDATQLPGRLPFDVQADWVSLSAHKFGGPRGIGALVTSEPPTSLLRGGGQERGHRAGTLNGPSIIGSGVAAVEASTISPEQRDALEAACIKLGGLIIGGESPRLPNTLSVLFGIPGDMVVTALDLLGIQASTGSACSSGASQTSHVLTAMGIEGTPVRFSLGPNTEAEPVIEALISVREQMGDLCVS
ncbi:MAG: cysteine desulfurase family protein [Myxococcota bacterium]